LNGFDDARIAIILASMVLVLALAWIAGWQLKLRRSQTILTAVNDATFGRCVARSQSGAWGFAVAVVPAPERFREFNISYQPMSIFDLLDLLRYAFGGKKSTFQVSGVLLDVPTAELIWMRGQPPARALGKTPGRAPWVQTRLDFSGAEYATRGANVGAMKHVFQDMYARFTPSLLLISIQRERQPQLRVVVEGRIEARDVSPLLTSVRSLGRAAILE
jgi:hypothetical protein